MNWLNKKYQMIKTAMQAGAIVGKCTTGCYLDDDAQEVKACIFHAGEIARLAKLNEEACS